MAFEYKEVDESGEEILRAISNATRFNRWMYESIRPYCHGRILEVGSGVGNISHFFKEAGADITLSDIRPGYRRVLEQHFSGTVVLDMNIVDPEFKSKFSGLQASFDSVFILNVVEHIENDALAISNLMWLLKPGGLLTVLVPAHQSLYNGIDKALEHYRRYTAKSLSKLMSGHGTVERTFYFNAMGIPAWWIGGSLLRQHTIHSGEMKFYNMLVPVFRLIDMALGKRIGLSVIGVVRKN